MNLAMLTDNRVAPSMLSRRDLLTQAGCGFGSLALSAMMSEQGLLASPAKVSSPLASKRSHFAPRAKNVIFLFMY